jgi:hypothetical protein
MVYTIEHVYADLLGSFSYVLEQWKHPIRLKAKGL